MPIFVKGTRTKKGYRRAHTRASAAGGGGKSVLRELKHLRVRQSKGIDDSIRISEGKRIKQLEKALVKKKDKARVFKLRASFRSHSRA